MNSLELIQLLTRTAARYRTSLSELEMDVYLDDLAGFDDVTLRAALARCAQSNSKYFPTIPEILQAVEDMKISSGQVMDGQSAWVAFEARVLRRFGPTTKSHDWPDDDTRDIVRNHLGLPVGGVHPLATMESAYERDQIRKRFVKLYDERRNTAQAVERAEQIAGPTVLRLTGTEGD